MRSVEGVTSTSIEFINSSSQTLQVHWLNYNGQRELYYTLQPGQSYVQNTYVTHPWLVSDEGGQCLAIYQPVDSPAKATISDQHSPGKLVVSPEDDLAASGQQGGPFNPGSITYTLSNAGEARINWTATETQDWLDLSTTDGTLEGGDTTSITVSINSQADGLAPGSYSDTVSFTNTTNGNGNTTRAASLEVTASSADLSVTQTDSPDPARLGEDLTYNITVTNNGPDSATGVVLTNTLSTGASLVSATPSQGSCSQSSHTVTCSLGTVGSGNSAIVTIIANAVLAGSLLNQAKVTANEADPNNGNNNASVGTQVNELSGKLVVNPEDGFVSSGPKEGPLDPISKTYVLSNTGDRSINVTVSKTQDWVALGSLEGVGVGGTIPPRGSITVTVSFVNAHTLTAGTYNDAVTFTNTTNGDGDTTRPISLTITAPPPAVKWGIEDNDTSDVFGDDWGIRTIYPELTSSVQPSDKLKLLLKARITQPGPKYDFDLFGSYIKVNGLGGYSSTFGTWNYVEVSGTQFNWYQLQLPADIDGDGTADWVNGANELTIYTWSGYNDNPGKTGVDVIEFLGVRLPNSQLIVEAGAELSADEGAEVSGSPLATFTNTNTSANHTVNIDWGDGSPVVPGNVSESSGSGTVSGSYIYADNGTYTVTTCVSDGGETSCDELTVTVGNLPPTTDAGADQLVNEGETVHLAPATFSDKGTLDVHTATINWGDGTPVEAGTVSETPYGPPGSLAGASGTVTGSHIYGSAGTYTVEVCVADDDGGNACDTLAVTLASPEGPLPPADLITNIVVSTGKTYQKAELEIGERIYVDRSYKLTRVPSKYLGAEFIVTANSDKSVKSSDFLTFTLTADATVSVIYDNRVKTLPAWLDSSWTLTRDIIRTNDRTRRVYKKEFPAGTVVLGGNAMAPMKGARSNYNVVAMPNGG